MTPRRALVVTTTKSNLKESLQSLFEQASSVNLEPWCFANASPEDLSQLNDSPKNNVRCVGHQHNSLAGRLDEIMDMLEEEGIKEVVILTSTSPKMDILWIQRAFEMVSLGKTVVRQNSDGSINFLAAKIPFTARFCEPGGYKPKRGDHFVTWLRWYGKDVVHLAPTRVQPISSEKSQNVKGLRST